MYVNDLFKKELRNNHLIHKICVDSREVTSGDVFFCINADEYITDAILKGAKTICTQKSFPYSHNYSSVNFIIIEDIKLGLGIYLNRYYHSISKRLNIIGITGTNGKTTTSTLVYKYLRSNNKKCTLIGSNGVMINDQHYNLSNTTPNIIKLYEILVESKRQNVKNIIMEVSSHGIKELRIYGIDFKIALFTNLTQDHLDYHKTMDDYIYTKLLFLTSLGPKKTVILNKDDASFTLFSRNIKSKIVTYGQKTSDFYFTDISLTDTYTYFILHHRQKAYPIKTNLLGLFNIYNITSFFAIINSLNMMNKKTYKFFENDFTIDGRMNLIERNNRKIIIDFAHTPDGVFNVLDLLNQTKKNKLIVVIGCGGNRDKDKREKIGKIVSKYADFTIFTSDNPRNEDPSVIIDDIIKGVDEGASYYKIIDRKDAIYKAITISNPYDTICILGKGNEKYTIVKDKYIPFNDYDSVMDVLNKGVI